MRHPAYADYPVVGVSWLQANEYCKWRTNAVNLKKLIDKGHIENIFESDSTRNFFDSDVFLTDATLLFEGDTTIYKKGVKQRRARGAASQERRFFSRETYNHKQMQFYNRNFDYPQKLNGNLLPRRI